MAFTSNILSKFIIVPQQPLALNQVYFFTATILHWKHLLISNKYKKIIIDSLRFLVEKKKIAVYAFVIMPNHIHLIWEMLEKNGKELPYASFMKFTAHKFQEDLKMNNPNFLSHFIAKEADRKYQFWQRNSLPVHLYSIEVVEQKLDYIHYNPVNGHWALANDYVDYFYSSAMFYEENKDEFGFLTHYKERF